MGWLSFSNQSKKQVVNHLKSQYDDMTDWSLVGNNLWALYTVSQKDVDYNPNNVLGQKVILLFRIEYFKHDNGYGYKNMCEQDHPYQYNCPLKFLKQAKVECQEWRDKVIKYHASKTQTNKYLKSIAIGSTLQLKNAVIKEVTVVSVNPLRGIANGIRYRIPKKLIVC